MLKQLFVLLLLCLLPLGLFAQVQISREATLMGSAFSFTVVGQNDSIANVAIDAAIREIERIENLISEWRDHTLVSKINANAGLNSVHVTKELMDLLHTALYFSELSDGAFDISIAAMDKVWTFDGSMKKLPADTVLKGAVRNVGFDKIVLDTVANTVLLKKQGMKIGFGSIGKGYAADKARKLLQTMGISAGIVNAAGDISTWGNQLDGKPWLVGVKNPYRANRYFPILKMRNAAVATSGSYEKYALIDGIRYAHIINPKTGWPSSGITSVSIVGPSTCIANGLSTSIMVLGWQRGKALLQHFSEYKYYIIFDDISTAKSKNLKGVLNY